MSGVSILQSYPNLFAKQSRKGCFVSIFFCISIIEKVSITFYLYFDREPYLDVMLRPSSVLLLVRIQTKISST